MERLTALATVTKGRRGLVNRQLSDKLEPVHGGMGINPKSSALTRYDICVFVELRVAPPTAGSGTPDCVRPHQPGCGPSQRRQHLVHAE